MNRFICQNHKEDVQTFKYISKVAHPFTFYHLCSLHKFNVSDGSILHTVSQVG